MRLLMPSWPLPTRKGRTDWSRAYAAIFTESVLVTLWAETVMPPAPNCTVNWAGLPRAVERVAVIW